MQEYSIRSLSPTVPEISGTVGELVDVLLAFVFPSKSGVTHLSNPGLIATHETVFSICNEFMLIWMHPLYCKVTCKSSAGPMPVFSSITQLEWVSFASSVLVCSLQTVVIPPFSNDMDGFVTIFVRLRLSHGIQLLMKLLLFLEILAGGGSHLAPALLEPGQDVTCCTSVVTSLTDKSR